MILIADSGSTKVDWSVVDNGKVVKRAFTKGINPFFQSEEEISNEIETTLILQLDTQDFDAVYFYGAGCTFDKVEIVKRAIQKNIKVIKEVEVSTDMLAAARGLCGYSSGIACIMGTGSNSCYYDGKNIVDNVSPLGFILGDEGSGAVLGKLFVSDLLKNQLTPGLKEKFLEQFNLTTGDIIDRVYRKPFPNRFLSTFSPFISEHLDDPGVRMLVMNSFKSFLKRNVMQYKNYDRLPIHFVGSVAFHFQEILKEAVEVMNMKPGKIIQSPMEGLIKYHSVSDVIL
ncbi:MAG: ATPase [Paludibacteraceae bacterium]|nr:ATPase [Paludibacteraceae bacterium]